MPTRSGTALGINARPSKSVTGSMRMPWKTAVGKALFVTLLPSLACAGLARRDPRALTPAASPRPNLLVVLSDDHRWDALGAAGNPAIVTPVMDRMASEGVSFRHVRLAGGPRPPRRGH